MAPVAGMGETEKCIQGFDDKTLKEGDCSEDLLGVDGRRVLKWIWEEQDGVAWTGLIWLKIGMIVRVLWVP